MSRIVHIALKVEDLEKATKFYEDVFGLYQTKTGHDRGHVSRHMTDGNIDLALMVYDSEQEAEAQLMGPGPCIHHIGIEVEDREATVKKIVAHGGKIFSREGEGALKFRAPDGTLAEIVAPGRYKTKAPSEKSRIVHIAIKVMDLDKATKFYEDVFGFKQGKTSHSRGHYLAPHVGRPHRPRPDAVRQRGRGRGQARRRRPAHPPLRPRGRRSEHVRRRHRAARRQDLVEARRRRAEVPLPDGSLAEIVSKGRYEKMKAQKSA